jgi:hypothetical protein
MSNQTVAQIEVTENLVVNLLEYQLEVFLQYLWNTDINFSAESFWAIAARIHENEKLDEQSSACSYLSYTKNTWDWEYKTTSNTIIRVNQKLGEQMLCQVEIPAHRVGPTRTHCKYLKVVEEFLPYFYWSEYSSDETEEHTRVCDILQKDHHRVQFSTKEGRDRYRKDGVLDD